ncbi:MAG: hypothetical protein IJ811_04935 [Clostridia bacterium]|nr:hypothetical protein [Clostridia bacterium]
MDKQFYMGVLLGMLGGALLINNVPKVKKTFDKAQKSVVKKIKGLMSSDGGEKKAAAQE